MSAKSMLAIAAGEVGYHEGRSNGHWNNRNKYAPAVPGLEWAQGQAWCAVFVYWCFLKAGNIKKLPAPPTAWVPTLMRWAKDHKQWSEYPAVGAVVIFGDGRHVGVVESWDDRTVTTIEGNTNVNGSPEGDGVYRKVHLRRSAWVTGYLYPKFKKPLVSADPKYKP